MHEHGFLWWSLVPGLDHLPTHVVTSVFIGVILILGTRVAQVQLQRAQMASDQGLIPDTKLTARNFFEILAESLYKLTESVIGEHDTPKYFPLIACFFIFIFFSNLIGLVPGMLPPTDNLNTTLALGTIVFVYYNFVGIRENGFGHIKHMMGPVWWLAWLIFPIELISHFVRPLSLGLRLRGNIMGDHMVLGIFNHVAPYFVPTIFYGLGVFVSFVQAFVFCLLTMVYISLSTAHDDH